MRAQALGGLAQNEVGHHMAEGIVQILEAA